MKIEKVTITVGEVSICIEGTNLKNGVTSVLTDKQSTPFTKPEFIDFVHNKNLGEKKEAEIGNEIHRILTLIKKSDHAKLIVEKRAGKTNHEIGETCGRTASAINSRIHAIWVALNKQWKIEHRA